jgi:hypothetical protein
MAAGPHNFTIEKGATFTRRITLKDKVTNLPLDLTGYTVKLMARQSYGSPIVLDLSTTNGKITLDAINGKFIIIMSSTVTNAITVSNLIYAVEISSGSVVTRVIEGNITIKPRAVQ